MNKQKKIKFTQSGFLKLMGKKEFQSSDLNAGKFYSEGMEKSQRIMDFPIKK